MLDSMDTHSRHEPPPQPSRFARLGSFVHQRRRPIILAWVAIVIAGFAFSGLLGERLTAEPRGSDRMEAARVLERMRAESTTGADLLVIIDSVDPDRAEPALLARLAEIEKLDGVTAVTDPWRSDLAPLVATDRRAALLVVSVAGSLPDEAVRRMTDSVETTLGELVDLGVADEVLVGGESVALDEFERQAEQDLARGEMIAIPVALLAMVLIFGGVRAAGLPIAIAISAFATSSIVLLAATFVLDNMSVFAVNVASLFGIGLGIDYGLILVSRFREERGLGASIEAAIERTVATAGVTVVFSALTVAVAISGMFAFAEPTMTSFAIGGLAAVVLSLVSALTLLPALLAVGGAKIKPSRTAIGSGRFHQLARFVQRSALPIAVVVGAALALLAVPFLGARLELSDARSLPGSSQARAVVMTLEDRFPSRGADPVVALADVAPDTEQSEAWLADVSSHAAVAAVTRRSGLGEGVTVLDVHPVSNSPSRAVEQLVRDLRADADTRPFSVEVGGRAAMALDSRDLIVQRLPYALGVVGIATLFLLFLMTGSVIIPIKAIVLNLLSLGASFGALVWVFQDGNLSGLLGFEPVGAIDLWMPVLIFLFAFGLSMDYEVFLLGRIKEIHDDTGDSDHAVAVALQKTGRIITSAALLIVVVFAGFATGEVLSIKQLGVGMALAVIVDAAIVRTLLVPAMMTLLGDRNWWAPAPLRRLHQRLGISEPPSSPELRDSQRTSSPASPPIRERVAQ